MIEVLQVIVVHDERFVILNREIIGLQAIYPFANGSCSVTMACGNGDLWHQHGEANERVHGGGTRPLELLYRSGI